jgi:hypothetical protein
MVADLGGTARELNWSRSIVVRRSNYGGRQNEDRAPDRDRINVHEDYELRYWAEKFGVTQERIRQAVKTSEPMVKDITALLGKSSEARLVLCGIR